MESRTQTTDLNLKSRMIVSGYNHKVAEWIVLGRKVEVFTSTRKKDGKINFHVEIDEFCIGWGSIEHAMNLVNDAVGSEIFTSVDDLSW